MPTSTLDAVCIAVLAVYLLGVCGAGLLGALQARRAVRGAAGGAMREHYLAGTGLGGLVWFATMCASLFSGYTVSGIVAESYSQGWISTRWIPGGVGVYLAFLLLAPRLHAAGKARHYLTSSEFIFDRYSRPASPQWVAHALRIVSFLALQLPIFTYLITQFQALGTEVATFTSGHISPTVAVLVAAAILLACDLLGGMRSVAFTDLLQGATLMIGSLIFLIVQRTELGGLPAAAAFFREPANASRPNVALMIKIPPADKIVAYVDFVVKTSIAATAFPHLAQRLFAARDATVMRRGMSAMNFSFFIVQLSSMVTGWCAIAVLAAPPKGASVFGAVLLKVASGGVGQAILSSLLLASAVCAMMSTADSALLAFSAMWVRDLFVPYHSRRRPSEASQLWFGRAMSVLGLGLGVTLGLLTIERGRPDLTGLFSLQNTTPIHVTPAVWLGLHWRRLRGEAVLAGMATGLLTTIALVFNPAVNVKLSAGLDQTACGLSTAMIGWMVNIAVTVALGLLLQARPHALGRASRLLPAAPGYFDIGGARDALLSPWLWAGAVVLLLFATPFYRTPGAPDTWVGDMAAWAFVALLLSGLLACLVSFAYLRMWRDYELPDSGGGGGGTQLPRCAKDGGGGGDDLQQLPRGAAGDGGTELAAAAEAVAAAKDVDALPAP